MNKMQFTILFVAAMLVGIPFSAFAIGVSVSPPTISIQSSLGKDGAARFTVRNPSSEVGLFEAYPEEFENEIILIPSRFVLEAGEKRDVTIRARRREAGTIRTAIAIESRPLGEPALDVGGGIRLPFSFEVSSKNNHLAAVFSGGSAFLPISIGVFLLFLFLFRLARSKMNPPAVADTFRPSPACRQGREDETKG